MESLLTPLEIMLFKNVLYILLGINLTYLILLILFSKLPHCKLRDQVQEIITTIDEIADNMENSTKKQLAINNFNDLLGWKKIFIPKFLLGFIIDAQVKVVRTMQKATNTPDLHVSEEETKKEEQNNYNKISTN